MRASVRPGRLVAAAITVVALALGAVGCDDGDPSTQRFQLAGKVIDALDDSGKGVGDVTVTFTSDTLDTESTKTSGNGRYEMAVDTDSKFGQVRAEMDGWLPDERTVFFDTSPRRIDLHIRPEDTMEEE